MVDKMISSLPRHKWTKLHNQALTRVSSVQQNRQRCDDVMYAWTAPLLKVHCRKTLNKTNRSFVVTWLARTSSYCHDLSVTLVIPRLPWLRALRCHGGHDLYIRTPPKRHVPYQPAMCRYSAHHHYLLTLRNPHQLPLSSFFFLSFLSFFRAPISHAARRS